MWPATFFVLLLLQPPSLEAQVADFCSKWPACCYPNGSHRGCMHQLADGRPVPASYSPDLTLAAITRISAGLTAQNPTPLTQEVWSVISGALPPGLTLAPDGVIGGTPTRAGTFDVTVRVETPDGAADRALQILVKPLIEIDSTPPPPGQLGQPYAWPLRVVLKVELETAI